MHASLDLAETLGAVTRGVSEATRFSMVVINLRRPSGELEVVCVEESVSARALLMGQLKPENTWLQILRPLRALGVLRFLDHRLMTAEDEAMVSWVPTSPCRTIPARGTHWTRCSPRWWHRRVWSSAR